MDVSVVEGEEWCQVQVAAGWQEMAWRFKEMKEEGR